MKKTTKDFELGKGKVTRRESIKYAGLLLGIPLLGKLLFDPVKAFAQNIELPAPDMKKVIMKAFQNRRTHYSYLPKELSDQDLSDVLWAAFGINRPETGKRTAPSGGNRQETDIYVLLKKGTYLYNAKESRLDLVTKENLQPIMHTAPYAESVPVHLAYVSNTDKMVQALTSDFTMLHTGLIAQNVNIYCAAVGLATAVRTPRGGGKLHEALNLSEVQKITCWQAIGYPGPEVDMATAKGQNSGNRGGGGARAGGRAGGRTGGAVGEGAGEGAGGGEM